ncbi:MAG: flavin reductase [Streptomyces sp.]|uniref:flavin reductase family protein n=1 Tax=Streptomyces sp. TaxID=1931 RepID=UPI0025EC7711|nr:flavin reductase family protein [Streptomyces sp.]MBW8795398.1 flavin reductase [Streptomyces sp.]
MTSAAGYPLLSVTVTERLPDSPPLTNPTTGGKCREVFAHLPAAVSVITTDGAHGPAGMTASAVCSLSVDPPLILVCIANRSRTLHYIVSHGTFAVNVLREDQTEVAKAFADPGTGQHNRFAAATCHREAGALLLENCAAYLVCDVQDTYPGGDHTIVTGRIHSLSASRVRPLIWHGRRFRALS